MIGLDSYIGTKQAFVGIDWLNLTSGVMKAGGGAFGGGGGGGTDAAAAAAAQARAEEQKKAAEASAALWKKVGIIAVLAVVGGFIWYKRKA